MPYIVVVIDEFREISDAFPEIRTSVAQLMQKCHNVGIHFIISTQRPSSDVVSNDMKINMISRMAFKMASARDSGLILDEGGAEKLLGRGDCLFLYDCKISHIHCPFVTSEEIERVVEFIRNQKGYNSTYELPDHVDQHATISTSLMDEKDPMFEEVARFVVQRQEGSTSAIQRYFAIGYNRAGRLMNQLEAAGIVGRAEGSKPREVLIANVNLLVDKL